MVLSLRELKEYLIAKEGYTINPNHSQLADLKALVNDMMAVRNEAPPSSGSGYYSGTNCIGHQNISDFKLSLGDIAAIDIKRCVCNTVDDKTAYCRSRTYYCSCNSNTPTCTCNSRTPASCDCENRTYSCACVTNFEACTGVVVHCPCNYQNSDNCSCNNNATVTCDCRSRTKCGCQAAVGTCSCKSRTPESCDCQTRTSSCGSRSTTSCTCNGRCACNAEKRFE